MAQIKRIAAKSMLHYHEKTFSSNWDANVYRGCSHRCAYCFAQYSHQYLEANFFDDIYAKTNAPEVIRKEFRKQSWRKAPVCVAGVSDAYQHAERECSIMPDMLQAFIDARNPIVFATKSTLPLRDIKLFEQLSKVTNVNIAVSISTLNEAHRRLIEPGAAPSIERLEMLREFKRIGCTVGIFFIPIIPYISDSQQNLEGVFQMGADIGVDYISTYPLHLRGKTKNHFYNFLKANFPELLPKYNELYIGGNVSKEYAQDLKQRVRALRLKYSLWNSYQPIQPESETQQLSLF